MEEILILMPGETEDECLLRVSEAKRDGFLDANWNEIAEFFNKTFRRDETEYRTESSYRKKAKNFLNAKNMCEEKVTSDSELADDIANKKIELEKARVKLRDERTDFQRTIREVARQESFVEIVHRAMAANIEPFDYIPHPVIDSDQDMIVCLSDLHAGIEISNWWNSYDSGVLKSRMQKYLDEIKAIQDTHKCKECFVVLGGDLISGIIHTTIRIENKENIVQQVKMVSTYIAAFVEVLSSWFEKVNIFSVSGNHSRVNPKKDEHLRGEELDELIPFYLSAKFVNNDNIYVADQDYSCIDSTITAFKTRGDKRFYLVHGDKDTPGNVVQNLTMISGTKPDGIIMGHRHHNAYDTVHNVKVIQCGCMSGTDGYCIDKRISGSPEQCVIITDARDTVKCIYDVNLK